MTLKIKGLESVAFIEGSKKGISLLVAVKFAAERNAVLQSAREAGAFRVHAGSKDYRDNAQVTRTGAIYFKECSKFYVAFDDTPDEQQNIILARAVEGYEINKGGHELLISKKDKHITQILKRAGKSDRIVEIVESSLELATKASSGSSEFGSNKIVQALFGDIAEPYAGLLYARGYHEGLVLVLTPEELDKELDAQNALVRPAQLGSIGCTEYSFVHAINGFASYGHARWVRGAREFSRG